MIILSHGQIVAEGTLPELQKKFLQKISFEIVSNVRKIDLHKRVREIEPKCELISIEPVEASSKKRFMFSCNENKETVELILRKLLEVKDFEISEFQICRPDLETIFLRATKQNWQEKICSVEGKKRQYKYLLYENDF